MPLLTISTNQEIPDKTALSLEISRATADLLGKPESYVMVIIQDQQAMSFAGNNDPTAHLQLKSLGLAEDQASDYSEKLCSMVNKLTGIPTNRIYIEFSSPPRHLWGWDNRTFG